jgi:hypothetical protein
MARHDPPCDGAVMTSTTATQVPTTPDARSAYALAAQFLGEPLLNHSVRSYLWARQFADADDVDHDDELLFVASMLHDLALERSFDGAFLPFEETGGNVAIAFAYGAGWASDRRVRIADAIRLHMQDVVDPVTCAEGYLLMHGTSADVSGRRVDELPARLVAEALRRWPRTGFASRFVEAFEDQAQRKPGCAAAQILAGGMADRARANALDRAER